MSTSDPSRSVDIVLDAFGQQILPIYTQICFLFPVEDTSSYPHHIETLEAGLEKLHAAFPWLAGHVVNEGASPGSSGVFKIKSLGVRPRLSVKDTRHDPPFPSFASLRMAGFPMKALDEDVVAPRRTLIDEKELSPPAVLLLQATLINGGMILTFLGQHQAMDGIGQDQVIRLFSKALRSETFTTEERLAGNLDESNAIPLMDSSDDLQNRLRYQIIKPQSSSLPPQLQGPPDCTWAYFSFTKASLETLKATACQSASSNFISTDDALSAFIWKSVTSARLDRLSDATSSTFARAVDVRQQLGISGMHPGFVQNMAYSTLTFGELVEQPLGHIATNLRCKIDPATSDITSNTRALATLLARTPDKSCVSFAATMNWGSDIFFASWAKMKAYHYEFGTGLGRAEAVRRSRSHATEGLMYLMPKALDGEIGLVMCLSEKDMNALKSNDQFMKFTTYVG